MYTYVLGLIHVLVYMDTNKYVLGFIHVLLYMDTNKCIHEKCIPFFQNWRLRVEKTWPCHFVPSSVYQWHRTRLACAAKRAAKVSSPSGAKLFCGSLGNRQGNVAAPWSSNWKQKITIFVFVWMLSIFIQKSVFCWEISAEKYRVWTIFIYVFINIVHTYTTVVLFCFKFERFRVQPCKNPTTTKRRKYANIPSACSL